MTRILFHLRNNNPRWLRDTAAFVIPGVAFVFALAFIAAF